MVMILLLDGHATMPTLTLTAASRGHAPQTKLEANSNSMQAPGQLKHKCKLVCEACLT